MGKGAVAAARFSHFLLLNDFPPPSRSLEQAMHSTKGTNINHKGLQRTANEYTEERRIYKDLISKNNNVDIKEGETAVSGYNPALF